MQFQGDSSANGAAGIRPGVLINPLGGRNRREGRRLLRAAKASFDLVHQASRPRDMEKILHSFVQEGVNLLLVSGGDGTIQALLTMLFRNRLFEPVPLLGILPGGTTNLIAGDVGIKGSQPAALKCVRRLLEHEDDAGHGFHVVSRPVLRLHRVGAPDEYGMFLGAAGLYHAVSFYKTRLEGRPLLGRTRVLITALKLFLSHVWGAAQDKAPDRFKVTVDGNIVLKDSFMFFMVTTLERLLLRMRPFNGPGSGPLHFLAVRESRRHLLRVLAAMLAGRQSSCLNEKNGYYSFNATRIILEGAEGVALDGQLFRPLAQGQGFILDCAGEVKFLKC